MVTNTVMDAEDIIPVEAMTPDMRLITLNNGAVVFVNGKEEFQQLIIAGLIDVR